MQQNNKSSAGYFGISYFDILIILVVITAILYAGLSYSKVWDIRREEARMAEFMDHNYRPFWDNWDKVDVIYEEKTKEFTLKMVISPETSHKEMVSGREVLKVDSYEESLEVHISPKIVREFDKKLLEAKKTTCMDKFKAHYLNVHQAIPTIPTEN